MSTIPQGFPLMPGGWLGMLGGGQLGRMFCHAAQSLGYKVAVLDPAAQSPAGSIAERHLRAAYDDPRALEELGRLCEAVTTEFENVPAESLRILSARSRVSPSAEAVAIVQDRIAEKAFIAGTGAPVAPHVPVRGEEDLEDAPADLFPGILKAARLGYDGKGQVRVLDRTEALQAYRALGGVDCVLEGLVELSCEISVVLARGFDGQTAVYPPSVNEHRDGILAVSRVAVDAPAPQVQDEARRLALGIAESLSYCGVLCVEFFVLSDGGLVVNEIAPRPHNSGHYTIDACVCSQFEQQARVMAGLPLGGTRLLGPSVMINLLGDIWFEQQSSRQREPDWVGVLAEPAANLHLYGKAEARKGRKMGHVTVLGADSGQALEAADRVAAVLQLEL